MPYTQDVMFLEDEYDKDIDDFLDEDSLREKYGDDVIDCRLAEFEESEGV